VRDQVDTGLFEVRDLMDGGVSAYLETALGKGWTLGYDPRLHSPEALERLGAAAAKAGAALKPVQSNPLDEAWGAERPAQPSAAVVPHPLEFAGETSADKRARVAESLAALKADAAVLTAPASIAWLFNIRGGDVIRSPLPLAQAILNADGSAVLFLDPAKVSDGLAAWLGDDVDLAASPRPGISKPWRRPAPRWCAPPNRPPCPAPARTPSRSRARAAPTSAMARP
jgi:Xaa-Pro aminopeptidase